MRTYISGVLRPVLRSSVAPLLLTLIFGLITPGCVDLQSLVNPQPQTTVPDPKKNWPRLEQDLIHDATSPALSLLQQPVDALGDLPQITMRTEVPRQFDYITVTTLTPQFLIDWNRAVDQGLIKPFSRRSSKTKSYAFSRDIFLNINSGGLQIVRFPHKEHTAWLGCNSCHDSMFKNKAGTTKMSMSEILDGKFCGKCHGKVAFPLQECGMCHNTTGAQYRAQRSPDNPHLGLKR